MGLWSTCLEPAELTDAQFAEIAALVKRLCGIHLHAGKRQLVKARLTRRLRELGLPGFQEYIEYLAHDASRHEVAEMVNALSTNVTRFFREESHFTYIRDQFLPRVVREAGQRKRPLRFWSAGCSSGEEPYSLALLLCEGIPHVERWDVRVLATDISSRMIESAREGVYSAEQVRKIPRALLLKYFEGVGAGREQRYRIGQAPRRLVHFATHNLMGDWPMHGPFDIIFCRNVMIYFDKQTQESLVARFSRRLASGGLFLVGHSESLAGVRHNLVYLQPMAYAKAG